MIRNFFLLVCILFLAAITTQAQNRRYTTGDFIKLYALKGSLDFVKTKYKNDADYYERRMLAKLDMEAIIMLMPENPFGLNSVDDELFVPSEPKGYFNLRTGLRFNGRGEKSFPYTCNIICL